MTEPQVPKADVKPLYQAANAARYAAKVWLPDNAEDKQVHAVAEKIYLAAAADLIASGKFQLPDRPRSFVEKVSADRSTPGEGVSV